MASNSSYNIYIPIWLDLLSGGAISSSIINDDLHSNMVRFIISSSSQPFAFFERFTFQYG